MTERQSQDCPLCAKPADFAYFDYEHRKAFDCASCGQYVITGTAERKLEQPPGQKEQRLARMVGESKAEDILEIKTENDPSGGKQIVASFLPRSSMRLP